ncbi:MAG: P-type ATPase, partial [Bdellovibrionota bacterium]
MAILEEAPQGNAVVAHRVACRLSSLLALALLVLSLWPSLVPLSTLSALSLTTFALCVLQLALRPAGVAALLTFLPAPALAAFLYFSRGALSDGRALAATAFAFQARLWLLSLCDRRASARRELARALEARNPSQATVFVDHDIESEVPSTSLREGHLFRLSPGQIVPADGFVTFGSGFVDESLLAGGGEDLQMKGMGSLVYAGTRNKNGALLVRATAVGTWTLLSRLAAHARL